ncbi:MAG: SLC13 family permease [Eubacteriales bacterium]
MDKKKTIGIIFATIILIATWFIQTPEGLTMAGKNSLGVLLCALVLWTTEAIPVAVTSLAIIVLQPIYGIAVLDTAFKEFISPVIFFVIATYGVSVAIMKTPLASRMARWLLKRAGNDSGKVILAFSIASALISTIVSNVPATVLFMSLAMSILVKTGAKPGSSQLGKALMIAIPFAAMIGGIATPAGSSINILALYMLEKYAQLQITFLDWIIFGLPIAIIMVPISSLILVKIFKPEPIEIDLTSILKETDEEKGLSIMEKKVLIIVMLMMVFWVASTWVPVINITMVAIVGLIAFFLPGINVLTWDEFSAEVGWDAVLMIGGVTSIGAGVVASGLSTWFLDAVLHNFVGMPLVPLTFLVGMIMNLLHLVLPIGPALVSIAVQPLSDLSGVIGVSPVVFGVTTAFMAGCCMLLPLDAVPLITYNKKYYSMLDMFKSGIIVSSIWALLIALWVPFVASQLNY